MIVIFSPVKFRVWWRPDHDCYVIKTRSGNYKVVETDGEIEDENNETESTEKVKSYPSRAIEAAISLLPAVDDRLRKALCDLVYEILQHTDYLDDYIFVCPRKFPTFTVSRRNTVVLRTSDHTKILDLFRGSADEAGSSAPSAKPLFGL